MTYHPFKSSPSSVQGRPIPWGSEEGSHLPLAGGTQGPSSPSPSCGGVCRGRGGGGGGAAWGRPESGRRFLAVVLGSPKPSASIRPWPPLTWPLCASVPSPVKWGNTGQITGVSVNSSAGHSQRRRGRGTEPKSSTAVQGERPGQEGGCLGAGEALCEGDIRELRLGRKVWVQRKTAYALDSTHILGFNFCCESREFIASYFLLLMTNNSCLSEIRK